MEIVRKKSVARRTGKDYSLAFKLQVVEEVDKEQFIYGQIQAKTAGRPIPYHA